MMTRNQNLLCGLTALSLIAPLTSFASTAFENGFYVGAKIGAQQALASWEQDSRILVGDLAETTIFEISDIDQHGQALHTNFMGNAALGYARIREKFFLAAEFSVNLAEEQKFDWLSTDTTSVNTIPFGETMIDQAILNTDTEVKLENPDIILDLRPGWLFARNFLLYGRVGVAYNRLSMQQNSTLNLSDVDGFNHTVDVSSSEKKDVYAWRVGLGMEYKLTHHLAMNIDYVFTDYGSIDTELTNSNPVSSSNPFATTTNISSSAEVTKNTATVGFNWYFGGKRHHHPVYHGPDK